jgi:hypothetical protein
LKPVAAFRTLNNLFIRFLHERAVLRGIKNGPKRLLFGIFQGLTDIHVVNSSFLRTLNKLLRLKKGKKAVKFKGISFFYC